ncbi:alpha/beta hydrolase [Tritonibacter mobilis]|uniref:Esterase/lipase superfamily enzyme n=1 Tax=Tritonibacter mobilis F1926 TaxID=1265309 RepID=A0A1B1A5Y6_9RHOB|nr:alpha/beta fold hydrolase [Tritonibacter mobilis]ANP41989.1 hypothetical protein K529_014525 [Tritonibacter mobilis F1926]KJZ26188.1 hypothetical protein TW79_00870 [Tritonibacter mobilis]
MKKSVLALCVSLLLAACADRDLMPIVPEAVNIGTPYTVFSTTTREQEADGTFGFRRSEELRMVEMTVTIPPSHSPGELSYRYKNPDPRKNFTIAQELPVDSVSDLRARFLREQRENNWPLREVTIFVHGYNSTHPETAYRAAQMAHDVKLPGSLVMYSWPSRGRAFGYAYDIDSMLFARDGLEETVRRVKQAGAERIILVAHSMGTALAMEMLRQADLRNPGWAARTLNGGVILISPDLDVDVFDSQMMDLKRVPQPFAVMVSEKDRILNISGRLRGTSQGERLGNIKSADRLERWPIEVIDLTAFNADAASGHFVAATSPSLLAVLRSASNVSRVFGPVDPNLLQQILPQSQTITNEHGKLMLERQQRREER